MALEAQRLPVADAAELALVRLALRPRRRALTLALGALAPAPCGGPASPVGSHRVAVDQLVVVERRPVSEGCHALVAGVRPLAWKESPRWVSSLPLAGWRVG